MRPPFGSLALLALAVAAGCAPYVLNKKLTHQDPTVGYRYRNLSNDGNGDDPFVILAFSGGGTRAAAFSFGAMEGLQESTYATSTGARRLLDDVDVISSVSGGSFTAAYYALFRERFFTDFSEAFLHVNIEGKLILRALSPLNWFRLARSDFDRIDLAAELYDTQVFQRRTFEDLLAQPSKPFILLNATDMTLGQRFEFTQDQFDFLCSDLSSVKIADGVAASSAFPGLLSPLTVQNYAAEGCDFHPPDWLRDALVKETNPARRYTRARDLQSYQDPEAHRSFIHLLDGGLADNIGLRGPYVAVKDNDSPWSIVDRINRGEIHRVIVIAVNAKTKPRKTWDRQRRAPGLLGVLGFVASGPMDNYSFDTVELMRDAFQQATADADSFAACGDILKANCPKARLPGVLPRVDWHAVEISFDGLEDDRLRVCLENLPTSFRLPESTVALLRQVARHLLAASEPFRRTMRAMDPAWQPSPVVVDPRLIAEVCGGG